MEGSLLNWVNGTKPSMVSAAMPLMSVPDPTPNSVVVCLGRLCDGRGQSASVAGLDDCSESFFKRGAIS